MHLIFGHVAGEPLAAGVGQKNIVETAMIADIENRGISRDIFFTNDGDLYAGHLQTKAKDGLHDAQGGVNFPMIHSAIKIGMERIRNPTTIMQVSIKRIITVSSRYL